MKINGIARRTLTDCPYLAFRMNDLVFRETAYGIVKRLHFFINYIETKRQELGLKIKEMRILDVGCGTGVNVTIPLANLGYSVVGLDTDSLTVERAQQIGRGISNIEFRHAELEESVFPEPFHAIICSEVIEHLKEPQELLQLMRNVLNDLGLLLVTVPNGYGYFELEALIERCCPVISEVSDKLQKKLVCKYGGKELRVRQASEGEYHQIAWSTLASVGEHCQRFTSRRIRQILTGQGFAIIEFRNRTFLAGNIFNSIVRDWDRFLHWNCKIADTLPHWMCSGWMIAAGPEPL